MNLRKTIISFILFLGLVGIGILVQKKMASLKEPRVAKNKKQNKKRNVLVDYVNYKEHHITIKTQGRVQSIQVIDLSSEVQGKIIKTGLDLKEGATFRKGQLIAQIDDQTAKLRIQSSKSDFIKTVSTILADIKIDYPQSFSQWENYFNALSIEKKLPKLPLAKSPQEKIFIANRNIDKLFYTIQSEEEQLTKYIISAPFNGTIKTVYAQEGSLVNPNSKIVELVNTDKFEIQLPLAEAYANQINIGEKITLQTEDKKKSWNAKIVRKGASINTNTQSINIYAEITENKNELIQGTYLLASIKSSSIPNVMEIPRKAVYNGEVYTFKKDSSLFLIPINVIQNKENTVLFNGLEENSPVVIEALTNVFPNEKVSIRK